MTTQQQVPGGRREVRDGREWVVLTRTFHAPVEDVWAAVTEPDRLARWFATWEGDPASGQVTVQVLFEGDDAAPEVFGIDECTPPRRLAVGARCLPRTGRVSTGTSTSTSPRPAA
ncbi:SRPBCC domain-containing protein [Nocardioides sp. TF02-7]|uniref:SRPBCC domain-containing protein n=1 Tax=Nocardioides sp. TF02-7 TaxID=2917724 RepID=UPI001F056974|nr:SRPBCC domain-containing protein [Nocardioides sp. TF02-7]UMG91664.1 SRPBCC domain-containing protein [Nocardioides sp. TF02-7]